MHMHIHNLPKFEFNMDVFSIVCFFGKVPFVFNVSMAQLAAAEEELPRPWNSVECQALCIHRGRRVGRRAVCLRGPLQLC